MSHEAWDWIKIGVAFLGGGFMGAVYTNWRLDRRNRIQPVGRKITVSYIDLPKILHGYSAQISLTGKDGEQSEPYLFQQLALIQIELANIGNKDITDFDLGVDIAEGNTIIEFQKFTEDRYHKVTPSQKISFNNPISQVDFNLRPFNRKDLYRITLVVNAAERNLIDTIKLGTTQSVEFVDKEAARTSMQNKVILFVAGLLVVILIISAIVGSTNLWMQIVVALIATLLGAVTSANVIIKLLSKKPL